MIRSTAKADACNPQSVSPDRADELLSVVDAAHRAASVVPAMLLFLVGMAFCVIAAYTLWQSGARLALIPIGAAAASLFVIPITAWR